jgi:DNA-binding NtrC family response regulator
VDRWRETRRQSSVTRIAVVDDDRDYLGLIADMFADRDWEIVTCHESLGAFTLLRDSRPDLVILDIRMETAQSGWDILTFLQLHPATHEIPVIICTASVDEVRSQEAWLRKHGIAYVPKPFDIDTMYRAVDAALDASRHTSPARRTASSA